MYTIYMSLPNNQVKKDTASNISRWKATCELIQKAWKKIPVKYKDDEDSSYDIEYHGVANGDGRGVPDITDRHICFNGKGKDSYETFYFGAFEKVEGLDSFCKTNRNGYTMAVMIAILCIQKFFNRELKYSSDGGDRAAWAKAREIVSKL